jgi:NodT family efflux transporter outer membrane factor (OMF) lipoprotein
MARALAVLLSACAAGPDFKRPEPPAVEGYTRDNVPERTASAGIPGGEAQSFVGGRDIPGEWWVLFQSKELNSLVDAALKNNPNIAAAQAALRQAQEFVYAQQGYYYPTIQANYSPSRQRASGTFSPALNSADTIYTLHTAQVSIAYTPDVFGGNRRQVESLQAQADAQRFQLEATYLTLSSNVVAAAVQEASLRAQIAAAKEIIDVNTKSTELLRRQFALGYVAGLEVAAQEAALAQAQQALPPLQKQLEQTRNLLSVLAGRFPSERLAETFELSALSLPQELPVSLPSHLVAQRPDVRAAEAQLHSTSAQIGVAVANMLPQFSINAAKGGAATQFGQMFANDNPFWLVVGNVTQTIFAGGTLLHRKRAADAAFEQAAAQYKSTVLSAFQNVADALYALQWDANALRAAVESERATRKTLDLVTKQLQYGYVNYLALLTAQQAHQQALINLAQARASRFADTAALFQALGGGWWNRATNEAPPASGKPGS